MMTMLDMRFVLAVFDRRTAEDPRYFELGRLESLITQCILVASLLGAWTLLGAPGLTTNGGGSY